MSYNKANKIEVLQGGTVIDICASAKETAAKYGASIATIYRVLQGELPFIRRPEITFRYQPAPDTEEPEEWRPVKGYEKRYAVSNLGRFRNLRSGRVLRPCKSCLLVRPAKQEFRYIWRLVAEAFVDGRTEQTKYVFHLDGNQMNNRADNLRWSENPHSVGILEAWKDGALINTFHSVREAERKYRTKNGTIRYACLHSGKTRVVPGMYFRYAPAEEE